MDLDFKLSLCVHFFQVPRDYVIVLSYAFTVTVLISQLLSRSNSYPSILKNGFMFLSLSIMQTRKMSMETTDGNSHLAKMSRTLRTYASNSNKLRREGDMKKRKQCRRNHTDSQGRISPYVQTGLAADNTTRRRRGD